MVNRRSSVKAIPLMGEIAGQFSENIPLWILQCRRKRTNYVVFFHYMITVDFYRPIFGEMTSKNKLLAHSCRGFYSRNAFIWRRRGEGVSALT